MFVGKPDFLLDAVHRLKLRRKAVHDPLISKEKSVRRPRNLSGLLRGPRTARGVQVSKNEAVEVVKE